MMKRKIYYKLLIEVLIISLFGLLMVYSASQVVAKKEYNNELYYFYHQAFYFIIGIIILYLMIKIDLNKIYKYSYLIFFVCVIMLGIVLIPGIGKVSGGARSWIKIGIVQFQPSEFMKIGIFFLLSRLLTSEARRENEFLTFSFILMIIVIIFLLIMCQPDFGTGLVIVLSSLILVYISGFRSKYFIFLIIIASIGFILLIISASYRIKRITAYLDPWSDPLGAGFQTIQSLFATIPGGIFGVGFNNSIQKHFFLPEPQNDFIFAIIIEELGLFGGILLIINYILIISDGFKISSLIKPYDLEENRLYDYYKYLSLGIIISIAFQVIINMMVVVCILPVTGITLPFISYGGSSLITSLGGIGLILNASKLRIEE